MKKNIPNTQHLIFRTQHFKEFFTAKQAKKHLNQLLATYLNTEVANNLQDRQKKVFIIKQLKSIIKAM